MSYVDGVIIPVRTEKKEAYRDIAVKTSAVFLKHGATRVVECWGDDVPRGKTTDFWGSVKAEAGEAVVFSWVEWPTKSIRDEGMKKVMADPSMQSGPQGLFDGKRMIFGGFATLLDTAK